MSGHAAMSDFSKKLHEYRGDDWKERFQLINYPNVAAALRSIMTKAEPVHHYDRHGRIVFTDKGVKRPLSRDEQIFRIAVLFETQVRSIIEHKEARSAEAHDAKEEL